MRLSTHVTFLAGALLAAGCSVSGASAIQPATTQTAACSGPDNSATQFAAADAGATTLVYEDLSGLQWVRCSGLLTDIPDDAVGVEFTGKLAYLLVSTPDGSLKRGAGSAYTRTFAVKLDPNDPYAFQIVLSDAYGSSTTYTATLAGASAGDAGAASRLRLTDTATGETASFGALSL